LKLPEPDVPEPPQPKRSRNQIQEFGKQYLGRKAVKDQKDRINDQLEYLGTDIKKVSEKEMARKVVAKTLPPAARLKYIRRGGKEMTQSK
jgi:hypothetical protein